MPSPKRRELRLNLIDGSGYISEHARPIHPRASFNLDRGAWIVLALEVSENAGREDHELGTPRLSNMFEIFDHTGCVTTSSTLFSTFDAGAHCLKIF
jgi:hypothetical protein